MKSTKSDIVFKCSVGSQFRIMYHDGTYTVMCVVTLIPCAVLYSSNIQGEVFLYTKLS